MLKRRLSQIHQKRADREQQIRLLEGLGQFSQSVQDSLQKPSFETRQQVLRLVVDRIVVEDDKVIIHHVVPTGPVRLQTRQHPVTGPSTSFYRSHPSVRTRAVVKAASATARRTGALSHNATAATAIPAALASSTRCPSSPNVPVTTSAASRAGASMAMTELAHDEGNSLPPKMTGPAALIVAPAKATVTTVIQSALMSFASKGPVARPRRRQSPVCPGT